MNKWFSNYTGKLDSTNREGGKRQKYKPITYVYLSVGNQSYMLENEIKVPQHIHQKIMLR